MRLTKRFMDWYQGNNDKEKETPAGGIKRVGYVLWNYVGRLVVVNMLFLLCCIPIVTIPAALAALNRYLLGIYRVGYGFSLEDYWKEFKSGILKNLPAGLLTGGLGFYAYYLMSLAGNFDRGTTHDVLIGCGMGVMIFAILIGAYYVCHAGSGSWRIVEKHTDPHDSGVENEYCDCGDSGNCWRHFAGSGTIFPVSAAYHWCFLSTDACLCLCQSGC